jgi:hypothetical protein
MHAFMMYVPDQDAGRDNSDWQKFRTKDAEGPQRTKAQRAKEM